MLTRTAFERARSFVLAEARPLERALLLALFEGGRREDAISEIAAFQNDDGGFGRAIEPDFRLPDSSPMATTVAFQALADVAATPLEDVSRRGVGYLVETWDPARPGWVDVPPAVNDHPHAPWWSRDPAAGTPPCAWGNPDAEVVAILHAHAELVPRALLTEATELALAKLAETQGPLEPYTALCFLRLAEEAPAAVRDPIEKRLLGDARRILDLSPEKLEADHFEAFWLAPSGDSLLAESMQPELGRALDRTVERQRPDGGWDPRWSWGDAYPDAWERARREWRGVQTLRALRALRDHGRIDGIPARTA